MRLLARSILFSSGLLAGCGPGASTHRESGQSFDDVEAFFVRHGPVDADTVVIFIQGGPFPDLRPNLVDGLPGMAGRARVAVHQPWTLNPDLLSSPQTVSNAEAARLNLEALEMLDRVVRRFIDKDAAVCVVGHSYGALLTLLWVATYDRAVPTKILAGRLSLPEVVWQNFQAGHLYWFPDGVNPEAVEGGTPDERIVAMRIQADVGSRRFAALLRDRDLSRMTFVFGDRDRLVGALTPEEIEFLQRKGARVVRLVDGNHRAVFDSAYATDVEDIFSCEITTLSADQN